MIHHKDIVRKVIETWVRGCADDGLVDGGSASKVTDDIMALIDATQNQPYSMIYPIMPHQIDPLFKYPIVTCDELGIKETAGTITTIGTDPVMPPNGDYDFVIDGSGSTLVSDGTDNG